VELTDDAHELKGAPGALLRVLAVEGQTLTVDPGSDGVNYAEFAVKPKVRRWNNGLGGAAKVDVPATNDGFIELEGGVEVRFEPGRYETGDFWLVPARTATGDVAWPFTEPQPPEGIVHHYCRLGLVTFDGNRFTTVQDCRELFPPMTELTSLFYIGGNGQVGTPSQPLPHRLEVGVANGQRPVPGATVHFAVTEGTGTLQPGKTTLDVITDANGVASCEWRLGVAPESQRVEATLLGPAKQPVHLPVHFNASFCEDAQDPGIQIQKVLFTDGTTLENDTDVTVDQLAAGFDLVCSADIAAGTVTRATCFLTLEVPFPINSTDTTLWGTQLIGYQPIVLAALPQISGSTINWRPTVPAGAWLTDDLFQKLSTLNRPSRVLARLSILGNFVWQALKPDLFLDAEVFGMRELPSAAEPTHVRFPSGDGRRGGRLDMWFWAVPSITISISPDSVRFVIFVNFPQTVTFTVTVEGTENTDVELSVEGVVGGDSGNGTISVTDKALGKWTYTTPRVPPLLDRAVTVTATSLADRTRVAEATVTLMGLGPVGFDPGASGSGGKPPRGEPKTESKPSRESARRRRAAPPKEKERSK
jgi:hypothetical protein